MTNPLSKKMPKKGIYIFNRFTVLETNHVKNTYTL